MKKKICAFLDRDGVINFDRGYIENFSKIRFRKGVIKGLKKISKKNYLIFIITNQDIPKGHKNIKIKILNKNNKFF